MLKYSTSPDPVFAPESESNHDGADDCIFCNIANKTIQADIISENDEIMVVHDILPKAPVHVLVIPKKHIPSLNAITEVDRKLVGDMVVTAQNVAEEQGIADGGYKLIFNVGKNGNQTIKHLHLHVLGGKQLKD